MPSLGNILARRGGTPMTGREVKLTILIPATSGPPTVEQVTVALYPVTESRKSAAFRAAEHYIAECDRQAQETQSVSVAPSNEDERALRFLAEAMRLPEDARRPFVESERIDDLRNVILADQVQYLLRQYNELIRAEYSEIHGFDEAQRIKQQAEATFTSGQG